MEAAILWRPIGELFVARGLISEEQLEQALAEQVATGRRLGEILVACDLISSPELTQVLMEQLGRGSRKEDGFGSGLWSEIRRVGDEKDRLLCKLVVDDDPRRSVRLSANRSTRTLLDDSTVAELEQDFEELRSELGIVALRSRLRRLRRTSSWYEAEEVEARRESRAARTPTRRRGWPARGDAA